MSNITFEQTLANLLCFVTHPCAVEEVERQTGFWHWVLGLLLIHHQWCGAPHVFRDLNKYATGYFQHTYKYAVLQWKFPSIFVTQHTFHSLISLLHCFTLDLSSLTKLWFYIQHANEANWYLNVIWLCSPAVKTYPDAALRAHNISVIGQLQTRRAGKHRQPVLGELQIDDYGLIHSCNNTQINRIYI